VNCRKTTLPLVLGLALVPCASRGLAERPQPAESAHPTGPTRPATPLYTNDDLERMRPLRDETGARSVPAVPPDDGGAAAPPGPRRGAAASERPAARGEAYWRREAEKLRERLRTLSETRDGLRARLADRRDDERRVRRGARGSRTTGTQSSRTLETRIAAIEQRMRDLEDDLAERARLAGALPGWLR